jgi:hypothetical protein
MASEPQVHLEADLQPEAARQLRELAGRIGGNLTTALHQAILLANLLYGEAENGGKVIVQEGNLQKSINLPKVDKRIAARIETATQGPATDTAQGPATDDKPDSEAVKIQARHHDPNQRRKQRSTRPDR